MPRIVDVEQVYCADCEYKGKCETMIEQKTLFCDVPSMPTIDAVPVVRCAGCKHYHAETGYCDINSHFIDSDGMSCSPAESPNWTMFDENDFCSHGERKDGAEHD